PRTTPRTNWRMVGSSMRKEKRLQQGKRTWDSGQALGSDDRLRPAEWPALSLLSPGKRSRSPEPRRFELWHRERSRDSEDSSHGHHSIYGKFIPVDGGVRVVRKRSFLKAMASVCYD